MKTAIKTVLMTALVPVLAACASHDYRDVSLLGGATEHNIQLHSVRDATVPNRKAIDGGQGSTGANAVAALRESKAKPSGGPSQ